jgi:exodeoxyribonuclease III
LLGTPGPNVKIATFNINNINARLPNLLHWLKAARPDVVCLQELKCADAAFPAKALSRAGYHAVWQAERTWNGVAILAREVEPLLTRTALPGDPRDNQARYIEAAIRGVLIGCLYLPNGNPQPGPKFDYKLAWFKRLQAHARALLRDDVPAVLAGDYNVAPTEIDIYPTNSWDDDALVQPESRAAYARLVAQGWTDALRARNPGQRIYTFWHYLRNRWQRDAGLRLDHLLLSPSLAPRLKHVQVDREVRGRPKASDHAPVWIELADAATKRGSRGAAKPSRVTGKPAPARRPRSATKSRRPLLVIDGDSFAHRAYHALPKSIVRDDKRPAGAILGFANFLLRFYEAERPRAVLVAWDTLEVPTYRHENFPAYQSGRQFDDAIVEQLDVLPELVAALGFVNAKADGYEADDFLAAAVAREEQRGGTALVASGDRDTFQLVSEKTTVLYPVRAGELARITPAEVEARYGVKPSQVPDFIALRGDPSDRLPGVPGIGPRGAADLLRRYGTLEKAFRAGRLTAHAKALRLYRDIATMDRKAPLPPLPDQVPSWDSAAALAQAWQLKALAARLERLAAAAARGRGQ